MSFRSIIGERQACQAGPAMLPSTAGAAVVRRRLILGFVLFANMVMFTVPAGAAESSATTNLEQWLLRRLNEPTERERAHERQGNVYIYDGLTDRNVEQALDRHFERIEYMMFVGTRRTDPTTTAPSDAETESPGCGP